ncbi:MAG: PQQ-like beta-propeller repeat protein [Planctomycetes bacterium]|nr:PQQ-like beta-propeller repeat protein [Planctomycetota bacterium]
MKRRCFIQRTAACCTAIVVLLLTNQTRAEDWPRWRGVRGDGTWQAPPLPERWPKGGLKQTWRQPIGGGYAGVSVVGGRVYTMDRQKEPAEVERVVCFDAATGKSLWTHSYPVAYGDMAYGSGPRAQPTEYDGRVYTLGTQGHACCLDAAAGHVLWSVDTVKQLGARIPEWGLAASPFLWRDRVVLHIGAADGCLVALDRNSGQVIWRSGVDPAGYATPILVDSPTGEQLIAWTPEHIVGIDPSDGREEWSVPYKVTYGVSIATPIYQQGLVFVAGYWQGSKAIRLGPARNDAGLAWEDTKLLRGLMSQPLYRDGHVYLLDKQFGLTCFELATGTKKWDDKNEMTPRGRNPQAELVWLNDSDRAIILNAEGELILARLTPEGYHEQSRTKIIGPTWAHPAFAGRHVYARDDSELVCVELPVADGATPASRPSK